MAKAFHVINASMWFCMLITNTIFAQSDKYFLLKADHVFDGEYMHNNWKILVKNNIIEEAGAVEKLPANTEVINLPELH
jgi:hypothetical protein